MQLKMTTDLATAIPQELEFNFDELKAELAERLTYYDGLVVTEDAIKVARADRASLNKLREAIEKRRKEVKKACMQPYTDFETKVKELVGLVDKPIAAIDGQLAAFEEKRKEEKRKEVEELYNSIVPDTIKDIIPLARIMDPKWLNATTALKKVDEYITLQVKRVKADLLAMDAVPEKYAAAVKAKYVQTLDIEAALAQQDALREAEEAMARMEAEREKKAQQGEASKAEEQPQGAAIIPGQETNEERVYRLRLEFQVTKKEADELKKFLVEHNIAHRKI